MIFDRAMKTLTGTPATPIESGDDLGHSMGNCVKFPRAGSFNSVPTLSSGFTLVELVLVMFLVGVIAVFAYPHIESAIDESRYIECESQLEAIRRAKSLYVVDHLGQGSPSNQITRDVFDCYFVHPVNKRCPRVDASHPSANYTDPYNVYAVASCPFCATNIPDGVRAYAGQQ